MEQQDWEVGVVRVIHNMSYVNYWLAPQIIEAIIKC